MDRIKEYEAIADAYAESMRLPFRDAVEQQTLRELLGDLSGANALDMACGDGFYTRWLKRAGASKATGVDVSAEMIRRAEGEERRNPLGCEYTESDIAAFSLSQPVDVAIAMYSLGYAGNSEQLRRFCKACHDALRPGGRFVGLNDNVRNPPPASASSKKYGFERTCAKSAVRGRHRSVQLHHCGRAAVRDQELLSDTGDLRGRVPRGRISRLPMGRRLVAAVRARQSVLGRLPGPSAHRRVCRVQIASGLDYHGDADVRRHVR